MSPLAARRNAAAPAAILVVVFFVMVGTGMMFPLLAVAAERFGGGPAEAGLLMACFGAARLVANLPAGVAADRLGRRAVMVAGLSFLTLGSFWATQAGGVAAMASAILLIGAGSSISLTAAIAVFADISTTADRGKQMSRYQTAVLVGISMGPVTGGVLSGRIEMMAPFALQGALALLGVAIAWFALPHNSGSRLISDAQKGAERERMREVLTNIFSSTSFAVVSALSFTTFLTRTATNWQLVPIMARDQLGFTPEAIGALLTAGAIANLCVQPISGRLIDGWGASRAVHVGAGGVVAALLMLALGSGPWSMWGGVAFLGAAGGVLGPAINAFAIDNSCAGRGATLGALRTAGDAGLVLGPLLLGSVLASIGLTHQQGILAAALTMAFVACLFAVTNMKRAG